MLYAIEWAYSNYFQYIFTLPCLSLLWGWEIFHVPLHFRTWGQPLVAVTRKYKTGFYSFPNTLDLHHWLHQFFFFCLFLGRFCRRMDLFVPMNGILICFTLQTWKTCFAYGVTFESKCTSSNVFIIEKKLMFWI